MILLLLLFLIGVCNGQVPQTIVQPDSASAFSNSYGSDNYLLIYEHGSVENGEIYSSYYRETKGDDFVNMTSTFSTNSFEAVPNDEVISSFTVGGIRNNILIGVISTDTNTHRYIYRLAWDGVEQRWGGIGNEVYSSDIISASLNTCKYVSSDGNLCVDRGTNDIYTYYWTGSVWSAASNINTGSDTIATSFALTSDQILYGLPFKTAGVPSFTGGLAELRSWSGTSWSAVEHTFYSPARPDFDRKCYKFGTSAWITPDYAIIHAPECDSNTVNDNVGAFMKFTKGSGSWADDGSLFFPSASSTNAMLGEIVSYNDDFAVISYSGASFYYAYRRDPDGGANNIGPLKYPSGYEDSGVLFADIDFVDMADDVMVVSMDSPSQYGGSKDVIVTYTFDPPSSEDSKTKIIDNGDQATANTHFGKYVDIDGDYLVTVAQGQYHDSETTVGELYVYKINSGTGEWSLQDSTGPGSLADTNIAYGNFGVQINGDTITVGAITRDSDTAVDSAGGVYVYDWDGTTITLNTILYAPVPETNSQFGYDVSIDGDKMVIGDPYSDVFLSNSGAAWVYKRTGGVWSLEQQLDFPADGNALTTSDLMGRNVVISGDYIAVSARSWPTKGQIIMHLWNGTGWEIDQYIEGTVDTGNVGIDLALHGTRLAFGSATYPQLQTYDRDGSAWVFREEIDAPYSTMTTNKFGNSVVIKNTVMVVGDSADRRAGSNYGSVTVFIDDGTSWVNDETRTFIPEITDFTVSPYNGYDVGTDGSSMVWSEYGFDTETVSGVGRLKVLSLFEACNFTSTCSEDKNCNTENLCKSPSDCVDHTDCFGEFLPGRLAHCNSQTLKCQDKYAGTCTTLSGCSVKVSQGKKADSGLGSAKVKIKNTNIATLRNATKEMIRRTKESVVDSSKLVVLISGTESIDVTQEDYDLDPNFADKVKASRCQDVDALCTVTVTAADSRRMLQVDNITITITYTLDEDAYNATSGFNFDDPAFLNDLAASIGVNASDIDVSGDVSGEITIEVTLTDESNGVDPLSTDLIEQLQDINTNMNDIGNDLITELGLELSDIVSQDIDLCGDRDCSGFGTCNVNTGVCLCTDSKWGINCETECSCENDGSCDGAYCVCPFPFFGQRCVGNSACDVCT